MRFLENLTRIGVACTALLALPTLATAQHSLTGRLVEEISGSGAIVDARIQVWAVPTVGPNLSPVADVDPCVQNGPAACIDATGSFTVSDLPAGTYLLRLRANGLLSKSQSVVITANTNIGDIGLIRTPFEVALAIGEIPASGGSMPVTIRVMTKWSVPDLPIVAMVQTYQETGFGLPIGLRPAAIDFFWPAGLTDTGVLPITTLQVSPGHPAGGFHRVVVSIRLQANPNIVLGEGEVFTIKKP